MKRPVPLDSGASTKLIAVNKARYTLNGEGPFRSLVVVRHGETTQSVIESKTDKHVRIVSEETYTATRR